LRFHSPGHGAERHGLIVILALGESIVAVGAGASNHPVSAPLVAGAMFGVLISVALWWLHFRVLAPGVEEQLQRQQDPDRVKLARDGYTILHFPVIAGIVACGGSRAAAPRPGRRRRDAGSPCRAGTYARFPGLSGCGGPRRGRGRVF